MRACVGKSACMCAAHAVDLTESPARRVREVRVHVSLGHVPVAALLPHVLVHRRFVLFRLSNAGEKRDWALPVPAREPAGGFVKHHKATVGLRASHTYRLPRGPYASGSGPSMRLAFTTRRREIALLGRRQVALCKKLKTRTALPTPIMAAVACARGLYQISIARTASPSFFCVSARTPRFRGWGRPHERAGSPSRADTGCRPSGSARRT